jgi:ribosomal protein S18 acetylase RimI-like enzyme
LNELEISGREVVVGRRKSRAGTDSQIGVRAHYTNVRFVEQTFGWDEQYQRDRFQSCYAPETIFWVVDATGKHTALVCYSNSDLNLHIALLLVYKASQGLGFGSQVMQELEDLALTEGRSVTLSTFKGNHRAISFYQERGYQIEGQDEHFYDMSKIFNRS